MRKFALIVTFLFSAQFTAAQGFAQSEESADTQGEASGAEAPVVIEQPAYEYYYWPEEDLNNFGLSTMGDGKSGSTLGQDTQRKSNIEVNSSLRSKKENEKMPENGEESEADTKQAKPLYTEPADKPSSHSASGNPIYQWKDEEGNIHVTNELGKVPLEYQKEVLESQAGGTRQ